MTTCTTCGQQEITYVHAAARQWQTVQGALKCASCVRRFPAWMRRNI